MAARKGTMGTAMAQPQRVRGICGRGKHRWTPWKRTGIFDPTERRDCLRCRRIQTRQPKAKVKRTEGPASVSAVPSQHKSLPRRGATPSNRQKQRQAERHQQFAAKVPTGLDHGGREREGHPIRSSGYAKL
jgi:hypothetical protein